MLLENLHEDCNKVSKKPYVESKDSNNRPDDVVALEYWQGFLQREKSIFVDLFYGQLKSHVQCSRCAHVSITFDPYNVLSLPIPSQKKQITNQKNSFFVMYYPQNLSSAPIQFNFDQEMIEFNATPADLKLLITGALEEKLQKDASSDQKLNPKFYVSKNKVIVMKLEDMHSLKYIY